VARTHPRDPLAPVEFVATFLLTVNTFLILLSLTIAVLDDRHSFLEGSGVCVPVKNGSYAANLFAEQHPTSGPNTSDSRVFPTDVIINAQEFSVCAQDVPDKVWRHMAAVAGPAPHPTTEQHWWNRLAVWTPAIYGMGALTFVWLLARRARREGFFAPSVARGLSRLGTYLAVGSVVTSLVVLVARKQLLDTMLPDGSYGQIGLDLSWSAVLFGVGLVTLGRVMGHAVAMREELDATV
jgi:hypothetical protein